MTVKLKQKLVASNLAVASFVLITGAVSYYMLTRVTGAFSHVVDTSAPMHDAAHNVRLHSLRAMLETSTLINLARQRVTLPETRDAVQQEQEEFERAIAEAARHITAYELLAIDEEEQAYAKQIRSLLDKLAVEQRLLIDRMIDNPEIHAAMQPWSQVEELEDATLPVFNKMVAKELDEVRERGEEASRTAAQMAAVTTSVVALSFIVAAALGYAIARRLTAPVETLSQAVTEFGEGRSTSIAKIHSSDEIGQLSDAFNEMAKSVRKEITDREEAEAALRSAQSDLLRQERLATLGTVIASVSHELRNPLGTINMAFHSIQQRLARGEHDVTDPLARAQRGIRRCDSIIEELLDYSRSPKLTLASTDVDAWLRQMLDELELAPEINLITSFNSGLTVALDQDRIFGCLVNLMTNATHAMMDHASEPNPLELRVETQHREGCLVLSVADTGIGMSDEQVERAFEPMFSTRAFGVGLGLPIVQKAVELHEGRVALFSTEGVGTTVELWIPVGASAP